LVFYGEPVKRVTAYILFAFLSLALFRPAPALASDKSSKIESPMNQTKQFKKYNKDQAKQQKKQMKAQQKEAKKLNKNRPTSTTTHSTMTFGTSKSH
jgi:FKBP-type peptidyl-prolyl cis-trans isomerase